MRCFLLSPRCISFFRAMEKALGKYWKHNLFSHYRFPKDVYQPSVSIKSSHFT